MQNASERDTRGGVWRSTHATVRALKLSILVAISSACGSYQHPNVHGEMTQGTAEQLFSRASFEFNCPREQIELFRMAGRQVGATGCGQRGVYVRAGNAGWVLNSQAGA